MMLLTRLSGTAFMLNPELIERVDATPDTVITLVDGKKYVVVQTTDEVAAELIAYRAGILAESARLVEAERSPVSRPRRAAALGAAAHHN